jgi:hypothetical protein
MPVIPVTYVSEQQLPMYPVYTVGGDEGEGDFFFSSTLTPPSPASGRGDKREEFFLL